MQIKIIFYLSVIVSMLRFDISRTAFDLIDICAMQIINIITIMPMSVLLLVVLVEIPEGRSEHMTERFDSEAKGELLLNFFIAFLETSRSRSSAIERGWVPETHMSLGLLSTPLTGKERF